MDDRDLLNLLRHAFLQGFNDGLIYGRQQCESHPDPNEEQIFAERDGPLLELIREYKESGFMTYNNDGGSHLCDDNCEATQAEQAYEAKPCSQCGDADAQERYGKCHAHRQT